MSEYLSDKNPLYRLVKIIQLSLLFVFIVNFPVYTQIKTIYVDPQLTEDCLGNYSISGRDCSGSDGDAYRTLQSAANAAVAGTQVLIRGGVYTTQLSVKHSGRSDAVITFKNFGDEIVEITGATLNPAIWIDRKDFIIIEGLNVREVRRWLNAVGSNHLVIRNNIFEKALDAGGSSKTGIFLHACNYSKITGNTINESTQDNIALIASNYNIIESNTITRALHVLWTLKCSSHNIIRGNYFHNDRQKIGEIYDCDNVGFDNADFPRITSLDDAKRNVVENNIFAYTPSPGDASPYAGIQYAGQHGIIRNNIFYECEGPPLSLTIYSKEATFNYSNRISHNVFYNNEFGGIEISGSTTSTFHDQELKNNIFYKNRFIQRDMRWSWYAELHEKPVQIMTGRVSGIFFHKNNIFNSEVNEAYIIAYGSRTSSANPAPQSLGYWEYVQNQAFSGNLQTIPGFISEGSKDFRLQETSPMIDAGAFLTTTVNQGLNSNELKVKDAGWFMDGFGITSGDTIQIEGQTNYAVIQSVDYNTRTILLDRMLSWNQDQGVSMKYYGSAPDIGAYEYHATSSVGSNDSDPYPKLIITPNPSSSTITLHGSGIEMIRSLSIYNNLGMQLLTLCNNREVDISDLRSGLYFLVATFSDGTTASKKVIKY